LWDLARTQLPQTAHKAPQLPTVASPRPRIVAEPLTDSNRRPPRYQEGQSQYRGRVEEGDDFDVVRVAEPAARGAVLDREAYGAVVPGAPPKVLVASAGSLQASLVLLGVAAAACRARRPRICASSTTTIRATSRST
jgi:hypothetical protein